MSGPRLFEPPRWAEKTLERVLPDRDAESVLAELRELAELRARRDGASAARRWYVRQLFSFALHLARYGRSRGVVKARSRFEAEMQTRNNGNGRWKMMWMEEIPAAARRLRRAPAFTTVAVLTIAIGIGAFTATFGLAEAVLLERMPYEDPEELEWVWRDYVESDFPRGWLGGPDVDRLFAQTDVFEHVVALSTGTGNLGGEDGTPPRQVVVNYTAGGLFEALGVDLLMGRETAYGPDAASEMVLSHALWTSHFGADPTVLGRSVDLNGVATEIVGVAPEDWRFVKHGSLSAPVESDLYMPLLADLPNLAPQSGGFAALVRIPTGTSRDRVEAAYAVAAEPVNEAFAEDGPTVRLWGVGLHQDLVEAVRPALVALVLSAGFLLTILAANLATLLLGRAAARQHDATVRVALGAGRGRLLAAVAAESWILAALGGALGLVLALAGTDLVTALAPADLPRLASVDVDRSVLAMGILASVAMAAAAGLLPAALLARVESTGAMQSGGLRTGGRLGGSGARSALVVAQVALCSVLLVAGGLTAESFRQLLRADPGFDPSATLTFRVPLPSASYGSPERFAFDEEFRTRLAALPGVVGVGGTTALPLTELTTQRSIDFPMSPTNTGSDDSELTDNFRVTPGYLEATGHRLLAGRDFSSIDADTTSLNIIIDDVVARRFFPNGSALGARANFIGDTATVIGVVDHARLYDVHRDDRGQVYFAFQRYPSTSLSYAVRVEGEPEALVSSVRQLLAELDPAVPLANPRTMEEIVGASLGSQRLSLTLILTFALGALALAGIGIYGVVANSVTRRRQEIGVRLALGAQGGAVVRMVLREGLRLSVVGAVVGVVGALAASRLLAGFLEEVDPADPVVYAAVAGGLVAVAAFASWLPARRATSIHPIEALKTE